MPSMQLKLLSEPFGVLKLTPPQPFPAWLGQASVFFIAQTEDEYSIICPQRIIPLDFDYSPDWRCLRANGNLVFDEVGIVASLSKPLADAGISLFVISTHDRDYVLVQTDRLPTALAIYRDLGFSIIEE